MRLPGRHSELFSAGETGHVAAGTLEHLLAELTRRQVTVKKGEIITTGALTGMIPAKPGTAVVGRLAGIGEVSVRFAG